MTVRAFDIGVIGANVYIVKDSGSKTACMIDCGGFSDDVATELDGYELEYILLTHGHFDHIWSAASVKAAYPGAKLVIHRDDEECLSDPAANLASDMGIERRFTPAQADMTVSDGQIIPFGGRDIIVIHTPGHSKGSVCFADEEHRLLFTGDTLFCGSCGRTDFPGSDPAEMRLSLKKLAGMDLAYLVYPGHGVSTTLKREKENNMFLNGYDGFYN